MHHRLKTWTTYAGHRLAIRRSSRFRGEESAKPQDGEAADFPHTSGELLHAI